MEFVLLAVGVALIVWGAELFAEHLAVASARLGVSTFALAVLLAGAEPEELATAISAGVRDVPAVAFGDVIGANVAICLVALAIGAVLAPVPFPPRVRLYALLALPAGGLAVGFAWDGSVGRVEGTVLVAVYVGYVATIWVRERRPPSLGETAEIGEALESPAKTGRVSRELVLVLVGTAAVVIGAALLVEAVRRFTSVEADQARLSVTLVGFATAFELVVLAWSTARRGMTDAVVAAVVGSYAYNATMTLGAAAVITPLRLVDVSPLRAPMVAMLLALVGVLVLAKRRQGRLERVDGLALLAGYVLFTGVALVA